MALFHQKPITELVEAWQWPDNAGTQMDVAKEVSALGGKLGLYDGCVERGEFSDGYKWRWKFASIEGQYTKSAGIGDWIVFERGRFTVMDNDEFQSKFKGFANQAGATACC